MQEVRRSIEGGEEIISDILPLTSAFVSALYHLPSSIFHHPSNILHLTLMPIQEKKYKEYLSQEYEPVDESAMPYLVDIRAIKAYADSKGVAIASLSDEEKQQFMIPNPNYRKKQRHGIAAVF